MYSIQASLVVISDLCIGGEPLGADIGKADIKRGAQIVATIGVCRDRHGQNLAGLVFADNPMIGWLVVLNFRSGAGGIANGFNDIDCMLDITIVGGELHAKSNEDFRPAMREGLKPRGEQISPTMTWKRWARRAPKSLRRFGCTRKVCRLVSLARTTINCIGALC